ncbi:flagellar assembly protein FliH [Devosia sp.]|uniref:FliH/SctL family protein n=1 Tax=Devosia sp. TaxID=1871048 RepID=UPI003A94A776
MAATLNKFTFDLDLGEKAERSAVLTESDLAKRVEEARQEGYQRGLAEGEATATARSAQQLVMAGEDLARQVTSMAAALDDQRRADMADAIDLAVAVGRKLAGTLIAAQPQAEIAALVGECMGSLDGVPHLAIRCAPDLAEAVRDAATSTMDASGFSGRLVVLGDPEIAAGDARIEWVDGGVVRDHTKLQTRIDACIDSFCEARGISPRPTEEASE